MIDLNKFEQIVKSMTAKQIIMAMVDGLRKPSCKIDMSTFGSVRGGICFGCAATNTISKICEIDYLDVSTAVQLGNATDFLIRFECAIDQLRCGNVYDYNHLALSYGFSTIKEVEDLYLPCLSNNYTEEDLKAYEKLAELQD